MYELSILLTGASGFIGQHLLEGAEYLNFKPVYRKNPRLECENSFVVGSIDAETNWLGAFEGVDTVIHLAGIAHKKEGEVHPYQVVNFLGTVRLAEFAAANGVKRFIFLSSVNVDFSLTKECNPATESKKAAEAALIDISKKTGMDVVIIRSPLVYGAGVKANFYNLLKLSGTKLPLPFACVNNKRSMVYVGNLVDFILRCINHPHAANETFLVSDSEDLSLRSLVVCIRQSMGRNPLLLPVPLMFFKFAGKLTGKEEVVDRLIGDLQVDSSKASDLLDWTPPYDVEQGIQITVDNFLKRIN